MRIIKFISRFIIPFIFIFILLSCISEKEFEITNIEQLTIERISNSSIDCSIFMEIENKSFWPVDVTLNELNAYVGDKIIGSVESADKLNIKAKSKEKHLIKFSIRITNTSAGMGALIGGIFGKKPVYKLKGQLNCCTFFFCKKIEIDEVLGK